MTMQPCKAPRVTAHAERILAEVGMSGNPYLTALTDGSMLLEDFRASQEQFGFAVTSFARPMASLISRMEPAGAQQGTLSNVVEEHGYFKSHAFQRATFRQFLATIGSDDAERLYDLLPSPQVHAFNSVLNSVSMTEDLTVAICCLGIIEHAFAGISAAIGRAIVERGWVTEDNLVHYALGTEIDKRAAENFFVLVELTYGDPKARSAIDRGLRLG